MRVPAFVLVAALAASPVAAQDAQGVDDSLASQGTSSAMEDLDALLVNPSVGDEPVMGEEPLAGDEGMEPPVLDVQELAEEAVDEAVDDAVATVDTVVEEAVEAAVDEAVEEAVDDAMIDPATQEAVDEAAGAAVDEAIEDVVDEAQDESDAAVMVEPETVPAETTHGLYEEIGSAGDWTAIRFQPTEDRTVCAIFSRPTDSIITEEGNAIAALRGERAAFITWESGRVVDTEGVFSTIIGAPLASEFDGHAFATDTESFPMFGHDDRLYVNADADVAAIAAIRKGLTLTLTATLPGNRLAQDTYSLRGVQASTELAKEACPSGG